MTDPKVAVGDTVIITGGWPKRAPRRGVVRQVNRVWIVVENGATYRFRLDDQTDGSGRHMDGTKFYTQAQWAERSAAISVFQFLREQGIGIRLGSPWIGREAELAKLLGHKEEESSD